jgi:hypothetical protein
MSAKTLRKYVCYRVPLDGCISVHQTEVHDDGTQVIFFTLRIIQTQLNLVVPVHKQQYEEVSKDWT